MPVVKIREGTVRIDEIDYDWMLSQKWHVSDTGYAIGSRHLRGTSPKKMHRLILERVLGRPLSRYELVDHINGDKLDNRRTNLRLATSSQNTINQTKRTKCTSSYLGVGCRSDGRDKKWMAYINIDDRRWYIGNFYSEDEAAWMRDQWALSLHGEFARLNFQYITLEQTQEQAAAT
jgi:hypothetical protein